MASASTTRGARKRRTQKLRTQPGVPPGSVRHTALLVLKWGTILGLAAGALGTATLAIMFWVYGSDPDLPRIASLSDYDPPEVSRVLTSDGRVIGEIYRERRTYVSYDEMPKVLVHAFVSAEDAKFFEHKGIDYMGMVRALVVNLRAGKHKQGGSTITQQVVKNFLLTREKTLRRKFQEIILARRLENQLSKEEIITLYANEIFFGDGRYGVQEAARYYFGKDVQDIHAGEAALLAGMPKAPSKYSPKKPENRKAAKERQIYVLGQMVANGFLEEAEAQRWINEPIRVVADPFPDVGMAPEWVEMAREELLQRFGEESLYRAGVNIVTTVDVDAQRVAEEALRDGLQRFDKEKGFGRTVRKLKGARIERELKRWAKKRRGKEPKKGQVYEALVREVHDGELVVDLGDWKASVLVSGEVSRYNPDGKAVAERFAKNDVVLVEFFEKGPPEGAEAKHSERLIQLAQGPEGAVVILEPDTRRVLAVVGGYHVRPGDFNRATMAKRQAGSTFKPIVYAAAVVNGWSPATIVADTPQLFERYAKWRPQNYKKDEFEGNVRLRYALAKSINTVAIWVAEEIGAEVVATLAKAMGIESELPNSPVIALGSAEVTPMELTNAFATFASQGRAARPRVISKISSEEGDELVAPPVFRQALSPEAAYIALDMMRSVITEGTGHRASSLQMDIAGKTGTSNDARDAWFVGVSPRLAVGVWVGYDDFSKPLGRGGTGGEAALPIFVNVLEKLGKRSDKFVRTPGIVSLKIDKTTGLLAHEDVTENVMSELFLPGTEPKDYAPRPGEVPEEEHVMRQYEDAYDAYGDDDGDGEPGDGDGDGGESGGDAGQ